MYRTKKPKPKIIDPLIDALSTGNAIAIDVAKTIRAWKEGEEISPEDIKKVKRWKEEHPKDDSRKIARCIVECICKHWVVKD